MTNELEKQFFDTFGIEPRITGYEVHGVDVSGCPHLIEDYQWWNIAGREEHDINRCALSFDDYRDFEEDDFCKENPNCYYKQHKRKEQECEELAYENYELNELFDRLKAENDELMKQHQADKGLITSTGKQNYQLLQEYDKLKTALTEIKEMLKEICMEECLFDWNKTSKKHCGDCDCRYGQILQKISECEVVDES